MKTCTRCGEAKPLDLFSAEKRQKDGRRSQCKACISASGYPYRQRTKGAKAAYDRAFRDKNRASIQKRKNAWRAANRARLAPKLAAMFKRWATKNADALRAKRITQYRADPKAAREKVRAWRASHPETAQRYRKVNAELLKSYYHKRRAKARGVGGEHSVAQIRALFEKQRGRCAVCATHIANRKHRDHIVPIALGGSNHISNIQLLCPACNLSKGANDPIRFMQSRGFLL